MDTAQLENRIVELEAELKRTQNELKEREMVFNTILDTTLAGFWDWKIQENTEYLSPTFKQMFGYSDHEMENHPDSWQRIIHPEDLPVVLENFRLHAESNGYYPFDNEVRYFHKNGSTVWVLCKGNIIEWDENGDPKRMIGCHIDITPLKEASKQKDMMFKELHHRVKNNLQLVNSILNIYSRKINNEMVTDALDECKSTIHSIALLHNCLYQSDGLSELDLANYLETLCKHFSRSMEAKKNISILPKLQPVKIPVEKGITCGLIVNELLMNAYKHAFNEEERGEIHLSLIPVANRINIEFSDNGKGFPKNYGIDDKSTFGLEMINTLVGQLKGSLKIENTDRTTFNLSFLS